MVDTHHTYYMVYPWDVSHLNKAIRDGPYAPKYLNYVMNGLQGFLGTIQDTGVAYTETHTPLHIVNKLCITSGSAAFNALIKDPSVKTIDASKDEIIACLLQNAISSMHNNVRVIARLMEYKRMENVFVHPSNMPMIGLAMQTGRPVVVNALIEAGADIENEPFSFKFIKKNGTGACKGGCTNINCNFKLAAVLMRMGAYPRIDELDMCPMGFNKLVFVMEQHVESRLAMCMGLHKRVGDESPVRYLNEDLVRKITVMAGIGVENKKTIVMGEPLMAPRVEWLPSYMPPHIPPPLHIP
ncbi:hypothetical protein T484DRAFT_1758366 [Baffinella frigidus]|nr:hypothetical protein T484DRAFT_1758366 [Cryptophyta sp. CCMP2293]